MPASLILQYPELILAAVLGLVLLPFGLVTEGGFHAPIWLGEGTTAWLKVMPDKYLDHVSKQLVRANLRSQQGLYDFATMKVGLACAMLLLLLFLSPLMVLVL